MDIFDKTMESNHQEVVVFLLSILCLLLSTKSYIYRHLFKTSKLSKPLFKPSLSRIQIT